MLFLMSLYFILALYMHLFMSTDGSEAICGKLTYKTIEINNTDTSYIALLEINDTMQQKFYLTKYGFSIIKPYTFFRDCCITKKYILNN